MAAFALNLAGGHVLTPPAFLDEPRTVLAASHDQGLEGMVVKEIESTYQAGRRSPAWTKVKHMRSQDVIIGGWKPGAGGRARRIGSLLLGVHNDLGALVYVGHVGTGFSDRALQSLAAFAASAAARGQPVRRRGAARTVVTPAG